MPYRQAWLWLIGLVVATVIAFWPGYFSVLGSSPPAFHLHGITASLWMLLMIAQSWAVHNRRVALHRTLGLATFAAVPLFVMGGLAVIQTMAQETVAGEPFGQLYGARLGTFDLLSTIGFCWLVYLALQNRRKVQLHARYMLATALLLIPPVMVRITDRYVPGLAMHGPQDFGLFAVNLRVSAVVMIALAGWLYLADRRHGLAWLIVGGITAAQAVIFDTLSLTAAWRGIFAAIAGVPTMLLLSSGLVAGLAVVWAGWRSGPVRTAKPAAA